MKDLKNKLQKADKFNLIAATITIVIFTPIILLLVKDLFINGSKML